MKKTGLCVALLLVSAMTYASNKDTYARFLGEPTTKKEQVIQKKNSSVNGTTITSQSKYGIIPVDQSSYMNIGLDTRVGEWTIREIAETIAEIDKTNVYYKFESCTMKCDLWLCTENNATTIIVSFIQVSEDTLIPAYNWFKTKLEDNGIDNVNAEEIALDLGVMMVREDSGILTFPYALEDLKLRNTYNEGDDE